MPAELMIRPTHGDHKFISDALSPGHGGQPAGARPLFSRLVLDATTAVRQPSYAEDGAAAGVPVVIDPQTWLLQGQVDPSDAWWRLPYAGELSLGTLADDAARREFVRTVVDFQIAQRATSIVPPYFAAAGPDDGWLQATLACLRDTAVYLRSIDDRRPLLPVFTGRLDRFARPAGRAAAEAFTALAADLGAQAIAAQLGPAGATDDNYAKVLRLFQTVNALRRPGVAVHVWRQGIYGPALVAAGAHGYETGLGYGEKTDLADVANRKRPQPPSPKDSSRDSGGPGGRPVFVRALGRSVSPAAVRTLAESLPLRASLLCEPSCCPDGIDDTLRSAGRGHGLRARAKQLSELEAMPPSAPWRLHKIGTEARKAAELLAVANNALLAAGERPLKSTGQQALAAVVEFMRKAASAA